MRTNAHFMADWRDAAFIHLRVDPRRLQPLVPFELDTWHGVAIVSLVAFRQVNLRPSFGGRIAKWLSMPLTTHEFLNLRTYVRRGDDNGIFFLAEWIPNYLAQLIGPRLYGLPYRLGKLSYHCDHQTGQSSAIVTNGCGAFSYRGNFSPQDFAVAQENTLERFLVERYSAFTHYKSIIRRFDVRHEPWPIAPLRVELINTSLLKFAAGWLGEPRLLAAHFSAGVADVCIGPPRRIVSSHRLGR